ncbi:MAG TPA: preprotein translocase subunit YajC [Phycisphaerales bacterium]|nr:preprotein translocase subunit YajC [Phycisphaerales bacterium]HMP37451.1 preprotein translocase subunit YajC [Phycisphaerales bacterium]
MPPAINVFAALPLAGRPEVGAAPAGAVVDGGSPQVRGGGGGDMFFMYMVLALVVAMILMTVFGSRRERKRREELLGAIKKHDRVQTVGGVIGSVVEVKSDTVVLKVDEASNVRITFAKSSVQQILREAAGGAGDRASD